MENQSDVPISLGQKMLATLSIASFVKSARSTAASALVVTARGGNLKTLLERVIIESQKRRFLVQVRREPMIGVLAKWSADVWSMAVKAAIEAMPEDELLQWVEIFLARPDVATQLPNRLPQQTFQEARDTAKAISDGTSLRGWEAMSDEIALVHSVVGRGFEVKFVSSRYWSEQPNTPTELFDYLMKIPTGAVLLLHVAIGIALVSPGSRTVKLDVLIGLLGWTARSKADRIGKRRQIWDWLCILDSLWVIGKRPGKYTDPDTKKELDLTSSDSLIKITGFRKESEALSDPPVEVTLVAGPWLDRFRFDKRVLQYFGDVQTIAQIPGGKPSGAWAQSIALALNQFWREQASRAELKRVGEDKHTTAVFKPFTRRTLLDMFPPHPSLEDVLNGPHPLRAKSYWNAAIKELCRKRIIGHCKELTTVLGRRAGWKNDWLDQPIDIRPGSSGTKDILDIHRASKAAKPGRRK